jgi:hypothetical protein
MRSVEIAEMLQRALRLGARAVGGDFGRRSVVFGRVGVSRSSEMPPG